MSLGEIRGFYIFRRKEMKIRTDEDNVRLARDEAGHAFVKTLYEFGYSIDQIVKWTNESKIFEKKVTKNTINKIIGGK